jgi:hypothetical protein
MFEFKEVDRGYAKLKQALTSMRQGGSYAKAGILGEAAQREDGGFTTVELAMVHEFGSPSAGVPERSFIRAAFEKHRAEYGETLKKLMARVYSNDMTVEQVLRIMGLKMEADIRNYVTQGDGVPPPNAPATIAAKGSDRPLVDTGRMLGSVTSEVVLE